MRRIGLVVAVVLVCAVMQGCGSNGGTVMLNPSAAAAGVIPSTVMIITGEPSRPHEEIAYVYASQHIAPIAAAEADMGAMDRLRDEAAKIGADAICRIERDTMSGTYTNPGVTTIEPNGNGGIQAWGGSYSGTQHTLRMRAVAIRYTDGGPGATVAPPGWKKPNRYDSPGGQ